MDTPFSVLSFIRRLPSGYALAIIAPVLLTYGTVWLTLPAFVFEHLAILVVLGVAVPWGLPPAIVAAFAAVIADNVLLREPVGRPSITGLRDAIDLMLFATVAVVVSGLVTRAHAARAAAQQAADRERRAREQRDRLIATVAHDLATPLQVLNSAVHLARVQGAAELDQSRLLDRLSTAAMRATSLVRTLTDLQALESNALGVRLKRQDLRAVLSPIVGMMDRFSDRHPILFAAPQAPVFVEVDAERLQRVIENLVNNAIKYSPDGGAIEISVALDGHEAAVSVRDHGIGISPDALPHVFDPSFRAPEALARAPGLGLGLSIAAEVVARHRGTITAKAADGTGTIVVVRLPVAHPGPYLRVAETEWVGASDRDRAGVHSTNIRSLSGR